MIMNTMQSIDQAKITLLLRPIILQGICQTDLSVLQKQTCSMNMTTKITIVITIATIRLSLGMEPQRVVILEKADRHRN